MLILCCNFVFVIVMLQISFKNWLMLICGSLLQFVCSFCIYNSSSVIVLEDFEAYGFKLLIVNSSLLQSGSMHPRIVGKKRKSSTRERASSLLDKFSDLGEVVWLFEIVVEDKWVSHVKVSVKLDAMSNMTSRCTLIKTIIDLSPMEEGRWPLRGITIDHLPIEKAKLPSSIRASSEACVTLFFPRSTPFRVWRWVMEFLESFVGNDWICCIGLRVIQVALPFDSYVLAQIGELFKKCCSLENGFTIQVKSFGIFYCNGDRAHFLELKGHVPMTFGVRWNTKRTGIIIRGLNLNGSLITASICDIPSTTLRCVGPPSKGRGNLEELHVPIAIEQLKGVIETQYHATKFVEFDGISLVVRSAPSSIIPSKSSLKKILLDGFQSILPILMEITKPIVESILDLKTKQQRLLEYWKGVVQMEMIELRNKFIIQFHDLLISRNSTFNGSHSFCFSLMSLSSKDKEYWQRALYDLREGHMSIGSSSQSRAMYSTKGCLQFLLGEFEWALLDFDRALNSNMDGLASTLLDRAMVKCILARYSEAMQDINMAAEINPNSSNLKGLRACLEDMIFCMDSFKSSKLLLNSAPPIYDLLTGDHYPNLDSPWFYRKSMEECGLSSVSPDWTEVRELGSEDLLKLDRLQQQEKSNNDYPPSLVEYLRLDGLLGYTSLRLGKKLAEGGQAEIFKALGKPPRSLQTNLVVKVFKQAFTLQTWLQPDVWQFGSHFLDHPSPVLCTAVAVKYLYNGRCLFVFPHHWGDLRRLIHQQRGTPSSPFEFHTSVKIMLQVAEAMRRLHIHNILHRDLKASNVLVTGDNPDGEDFRCLVADFECSAGVMGTGFWRAPEILTQLKHQISKPEELAWSKEADVYGFGMTCYEILTGDTPFRNLKASDWDVVLTGGRPQLPHFLDPKLRTLIELCWHDDPEERPNFSMICRVLADVKGNPAGPAGHVQIHQESVNSM